MLEVAETPAEWLIEQFEETFREYGEGNLWFEDLGLGEAREMAELIDDLAGHGDPAVCGLCGWDQPWFSLILDEIQLMFPIFQPADTPSSRRAPSGRYLQAGLPPV
jgi:hypothetical protein